MEYYWIGKIRRHERLLCEGIPDTDGTGGYYLLFSKDFSNTQSEGYDEWYPNLDELSNRFSDLT